jgi:cytochrome P450
MDENLYPQGPKSRIPGGVFISLYLDPIRFFMRAAREYGDIAHIQMGRRHYWLLNHPDHIRDILQAPEEQMLHSFSRTGRRVMGKGLLCSQGAFHRSQRRKIQPFFHHQQIAAWGESMSQSSLSASKHWRDGQTLNIAEWMSDLTFELALKALLGADVDEGAPEIRAAIHTIMADTGKRAYLWKALTAWFPYDGDRRLNQAIDTLDGLVFRLISKRKNQKGEPSDLLSMLVRMQNPLEESEGTSDQQIRDEAVTMLIAGHETIANALNWTCYLLALHPDAEHKLHEELDALLGGRPPTMEDLPRLTFTTMLFSESMRLYPPVWLIVRRCVQDWQIGEYRAPAGSYMYLSQFVMHRHPRYFPDPERFDPLRWTPENCASRPKFCYFPFAGGSRRCIGEGFAWAEGLLVLATLAQKWQMRTVPGHPVVPEPHVTLRPKHGMTMTVHLRRHTVTPESSGNPERAS